MLINTMPPPLYGYAGIGDTAALCPTGNGLEGDPFGITDVLGIVSNFITAGKQEKIQKQQIGVEQSQLKQQKVVDAENFAAQQALVLTQASQQERHDQVIGLTLVGAGAVFVAVMFVYGAVRK